jgi:hypothetical protein
MKKIPLVFVLDRASGALTADVRPESAWVLAGEGIATLKHDGTATRWQGGRLWKRYDRKLHKAAQRRLDRGEALDPLDESLFKAAPAGFEACNAQADPVTYHWPGWAPIDPQDPADQWHRQALESQSIADLEEGATYELVGPAFSRNPYALERHALWKHGRDVVDVPDRTFEGLRSFLTGLNGEGLVFHHADGRMAKIRRKDFGLVWIQADTRDLRDRRYKA